MRSACRSCRAPIVWARTLRDKAIPVDPSPRVDGNLTLELSDDGRTYIAHPVDPLTPLGELRYVSHFATCPNADAHRKGGAA